MTVGSSTQSKMGLPLAENGIFPSFTAPEVGVTPNFARTCSTLILVTNGAI